MIGSVRADDGKRHSGGMLEEEKEEMNRHGSEGKQGTNKRAECGGGAPRK